MEIDTVADLGKLALALSHNEFSKEDVQAILARNWLRILESALPA
jgi:microsomal dipeptidase-like Zn-dependent dipeptidase